MRIHSSYLIREISSLDAPPAKQISTLFTLRSQCTFTAIVRIPDILNVLYSVTPRPLRQIPKLPKEQPTAAFV